MKFSVCIGSIRAESLPAALASVERQTWRDWELIVVGQGDDPALQAAGETAMKRDDRIRYIHIDERGVSRARNVAIRAAKGEIIAMTDDDCEAKEDWLQVLAEYFAAAPGVQVVGGAVVAPPSGGRWLWNCPEYVPPEAIYDPVASGRHAPPGFSWVTGNVAFRREVFQRAGEFDECFGPGAIFKADGDTEYLSRLDIAGVRMGLTPRAVVVHTYGCRQGFGPLLQRSINYSWSRGALAAKLELLGDRRGRKLLSERRRESTIGWLRPFRPHRIPLGLVQLWYFNRGYRRCLRDYRVDPARGVLEPISGLRNK